MKKTRFHRLARRLKEADIPYSVSPADCSYPDSLYYDSQYHLTRQGGLLHSRRLATRLKDFIKLPPSQ